MSGYFTIFVRLKFIHFFEFQNCAIKLFRSVSLHYMLLISIISYISSYTANVTAKLCMHILLANYSLLTNLVYVGQCSTLSKHEAYMSLYLICYLQKQRNIELTMYSILHHSKFDLSFTKNNKGFSLYTRDMAMAPS